MIICKEVLETAGPVSATHQKTKHTLLTTHETVPRILFDGCMGCALTNEKVYTLHTETAEHRLRRLIREHIYLVYLVIVMAYQDQH